MNSVIYPHYVKLIETCFNMPEESYSLRIVESVVYWISSFLRIRSPTHLRTLQHLRRDLIPRARYLLQWQAWQRLFGLTSWRLQPLHFPWVVFCAASIRERLLFERGVYYSRDGRWTKLHDEINSSRGVWSSEYGTVGVNDSRRKWPPVIDA